MPRGVIFDKKLPTKKKRPKRPKIIYKTVNNYKMNAQGCHICLVSMVVFS